MEKCVRASGGAHNLTHLISGRAARRTSCAFAACVVACGLLTVVCLFCVAVGWAVLVFVDYVMVCILHAVLSPPFWSVFCSDFGYHRYVCNSLLSGSVLFSVVLCCVLCNVLFCLPSILSCLGWIRHGRVVLVCSAMSSYGMLRASPIWSFLFSVLVCVVHVVLPYVRTNVIVTASNKNIASVV